MKLIAAIGTVALACAIVVAWRAGRGQAAEAVDPAAEEARAETTDESPAGGALAPVAERGPSNDRAAIEPKPRPEAQGIEDGSAKALESPRENEWRARYDGLTNDEVAAELGRIESELELEKQRLYGERVEAGDFDEYPIDAGDGRELDEIARSYERPGELCSTQLVFDAGASGTAPVRPRAVRVVCLSPEAHPDLFDLAAERDWLRKRVAGGRGDE